MKNWFFYVDFITTMNGYFLLSIILLFKMWKVYPQFLTIEEITLRKKRKCMIRDSTDAIFCFSIYYNLKVISKLNYSNLWLECKKTFDTYISTLSTLTPHGSVASSNEDCITWLIVSLSDNISAKFLVPNTFLNVVAANNRVEWLGRW